MSVEPNQPGYRYWVVDINTVSIESGWEYREDAMERAKALKEEGGVPKICTKHRCAVGNQNLDPNDPASWVPRRNEPAPSGISRRNPEPGRLQRYRDAAGHVVEAGRHAQRAYRAVRPAQRTNPGDNARTDVRSPTSSSTEVRSPTSTSTDAYTAGNVTVTGGAGAGATTRVSITSPGPRSRSSRDEHREWRDGRNGVARAIDRSQRDDRVTQQDVHSLTRGRGRQEFADAPRGRHEPDFHDVDDDDVHENPGELLIVNGAEDLDDNPGTHKAEKVYAMWHQKEPGHVGVVRLTNSPDDVMVCVGNAFSVCYRSKKWESGNKTNDYVHHHDKGVKVWMLESKTDPEDVVGTSRRTAGQLCAAAQGTDGRFAVAELATPLSLCLENGDTDGDEISIHSGGKVYGAIDKKTVIIVDPHWGLIVVRGGQMTFDERGIVK